MKNEVGVWQICTYDKLSSQKCQITVQRQNLENLNDRNIYTASMISASKGLEHLHIKKILTEYGELG
jgi:hypothetical protein